MDFKKLLPHIIAILVIFAINLAYWLPQYQGKVIEQGDINQWRKMASEIINYNEKTGESPLWTNSMFSGMPSYQISTPTNANKLSWIDKAVTLFQSGPSSFFIGGAIIFYITMLLLGINPWISLIGALLFSLSTSLMIPFEAGHTSKIKAVMVSPAIIAGIILTYRGQLVKGGLLFAIAMGLNIMYNHVQMTFYLGMILVPLVLVYLVFAIKEGKVLDFVKGSAVLAIGLGLAVGASASRLWTTYEYGKDTMRGAPILKSENVSVDKTNSSEVDGLAYDYAMSWSNGWGDLMAAYIPMAVGGGSVEELPKDNPLVRKVGQRRLPTYHGDMAFTSGPMYLGAFLLFLCMVGAFILKGALRFGLIAGLLLALLVSLGKNFAVLNDLFFYYLPLFNKFRAHSSILVVTTALVGVFGTLTLQEIITRQDKSTLVKPLLYSLGIMGGFAALMALLGTSIINFSSPADSNYAQIAGDLVDIRKSMFRASAFRTLLIVLLSGGLLYMLLKEKVSKNIALIGLTLIGIFDVAGTSLRYLNHDNFISKRNSEQAIEPRPVDQQILKDKDPHYRVYDATINTFNSSDASMFHKTIGGYHAAKLQRYQDIIDKHISKSNQKVLNMLNTKYFIVPGPNEQPIAQQNPSAYGNAWFVEDIQIVPNANAEINGLNGFKADSIAIIHEEFSSYINGLNPSKNGTITLTSYAPDKLVYKSSATSDQLAIFSEVWYGPNKGWQAYIDGKAVDHIRANYILRALKVPAGDHEIIFEFKPISYARGEQISLFSSLLMLLCLIGYIGYNYWSKSRRLDN